ncbi:MAG: hypothetical protein CMI94_02560 [Pelagibacteraceae bacterium]|nr:hypothetical protein [Pelagibacteraceae bacterium]|tara:strand:- start:2251 stop:2502 length:252 start_codon:yes stop_codon:yes gene_type:complete
MLSFLAIDTSPKWLLVFFVCSGEPALIKDPKNDINCKKVEQQTYSLKHCQNSQTLVTARINSPHFVVRSKCVEITKKKNPNIG